jgi:hypothetical protein
MQLVVWNSQGAKWDDLWTYYYSPLLGGNEDVIGLLVEAGWAPWVKSQEVHVDEVYGFDANQNWYYENGARNSGFVQGVEASRQRTAFWVPWRKSLDSGWSNSRCSMGCVATLAHRSITTTRYRDPNAYLYLRPIFQFLCSIRTGHANQPDFSVFLVHLVSGHTNRAQQQIEEVINNMRKIIPERTGAIIVGDFNINLQTTTINVPNFWRILRTGVSTQGKSAQEPGGELDYALLYDPFNNYSNATVTHVQQFKTGNNRSDHSVLRFGIPL